MRVIGLIPARMTSSRFPGKPLVKIEDIPMIIHVMKRAILCKDLDDVYVATDSNKIVETVERYGGKAIRTDTNHETGTDRIAEAVDKVDCDIAVNIQGDEPLVKPDDIGRLVKTIVNAQSVQVATLVCKTPTFSDISECKVVLDLNNDILYMSRSDIPSPARIRVDSLYKLYCIVAFQKTFLKRFASWPLSPLEKIEFIEYLRIIEHGYKIRGVIVEGYTTSVDTPEDLTIIKKMMEQDKIKHSYL